MVFSTRGRCNDDAMKFFRPDKKKNGCIEGRPDTHTLSGLSTQECLIEILQPGQQKKYGWIKEWPTLPTVLWGG